MLKEEVVVKYHVVVSQRAEPCSVSDNYDDFFGSDLNFKSDIFLSGRNFYYKNGQAWKKMKLKISVFR